jgi:hypothetical protein
MLELFTTRSRCSLDTESTEQAFLPDRETTVGQNSPALKRRSCEKRSRSCIRTSTRFACAEGFGLYPGRRLPAGVNDFSSVSSVALW